MMQRSKQGKEKYSIIVDTGYRFIIFRVAGIGSPLNGKEVLL